MLTSLTELLRKRLIISFLPLSNAVVHIGQLGIETLDLEIPLCSRLFRSRELVSRRFAQVNRLIVGRSNLYEIGLTACFVDRYTPLCLENLARALEESERITGLTELGNACGIKLAPNARLLRSSFRISYTLLYLRTLGNEFVGRTLLQEAAQGILVL